MMSAMEGALTRRALVVAALLLPASPLRAGPADPEARIEGLYLRPDGLRVRTSRPVPHQVFLLTDPLRLVLSLEGTRLEGNGAEKAFLANGPRILSVRTGQFQDSPAVARVVLDLREPAPYRVLETPEGLVLALGESAAQAAPAGTGPPEPLLDALAPLPPRLAPPVLQPAPEFEPPVRGSDFLAFLACLLLACALCGYMALRLHLRERRLRVHEEMILHLEGRLAQLESLAPAATSGTEEELRELRAVLRSMQRALGLPHP